MTDRVRFSEADLAPDPSSVTDADGAPSVATDDGADDGEVVAALREVPMLREPRRLPGRKPAGFAPEQFFVLSRVTRTDVGLDDDGLWLTEEAAPRISGDGIQFHGQLFWHADLLPYVQLPARDPRHFVVRYDRALLARGVLDELQLLEVMPDGRRVPRCRVGLKSEALRVLDSAMVIRHVDRYRRLLKAKVSAAHDELISIEHGRRALEEHHAQERARMRRQQRATPEPMAAKPIFGAGELDRARRADAERNERLAGYIGPNRDMEAAADSGAADEEVGPVPLPRSAPAVGPRTRRRQGVAAGSAPAPASHQDAAAPPTRAAAPTDDTGAGIDADTPARPSDHDRARRLAEHLGGTLGLATSDDD